MSATEAEKAGLVSKVFPVKDVVKISLLFISVLTICYTGR